MASTAAAARHCSGDESVCAELLLPLLCGWKQQPGYIWMQGASKPATRLCGTLLSHSSVPGVKAGSWHRGMGEGGGQVQRAPADLCPRRLRRRLAPGIPTPRDGCQLGGRVCHPVTGTNIELQSHSCPRRLCGAILLAQPLLLGFLFPICFPPCDVPRFDFQGQFPQGLLSQVVAEVVEE